MAKSSARAARRAAARVPVIETEADKIARLRVLRQLREAGILPPDARVAVPAEAPKGARVLTKGQAVRAGVGQDADAPKLELQVVTRGEGVLIPAPPPPRHAPDLDAKRDARLADNIIAAADVEHLAHKALAGTLTQGELLVMLHRAAHAGRQSAPPAAAKPAPYVPPPPPAAPVLTPAAPRPRALPGAEGLDRLSTADLRAIVEASEREHAELAAGAAGREWTPAEASRGRALRLRGYRAIEELASRHAPA
jgi:hypothetical protein